MSDAPAASLLAIERLDVEPAAEPGRELLIEGFSLTIAAGETVGLVGETGAGKSLSMRAGVGLLPAGIVAVRGSVCFGGTEASAADAAALRAHLGHGICLLPQNGRGSLNPFLRIGAQIERVLGYQGVPRRERARRAATLLEAVDLPASDFLRRYPHQVSGGQAQRIAMVLALATNPRMLIADEPTTALDVTTERVVIRLLKKLCRERHMALVLITHNLGLVASNCDRVLIMHAGHIVESGPTATLFSRPSHPYTRALLAAIPDIDAPSKPVAMAGSVPRRGTMGAGCRFISRCPERVDLCRVAVPQLYAVDGRLVRCLRRNPEAGAKPKQAAEQEVSP